ncbi:hypothetical protein ACLI4R_18955 [Natrialbaceae archaeon A-chndr2]
MRRGPTTGTSNTYDLERLQRFVITTSLVGSFFSGVIARTIGGSLDQRLTVSALVAVIVIANTPYRLASTITEGISYLAITHPTSADPGEGERVREFDEPTLSPNSKRVSLQ